MKEVELNAGLNPNIPSPDKGVIDHKEIDGLDVFVIRNGEPLGSNSVVTIPWAAAAVRDGKYIHALSIEREDLRMIARYTGESVKKLFEEYGTKDYLLEPRLMMYYGGESENLGAVNINQSEESIKNYLFETLLETLDSIDE